MTFDDANIAHYNEQLIDEYERIRDFIVLHYGATERDDTSFWRRCREMKMPDTLIERMEMYKGSGRIFQRRYELFTELSWFFVMHGMGLVPRDYDPLADTVNFEEVKRLMVAVRQQVASEVARAPSHDSFFPEKRRELNPASGWKIAGSAAN
jgi:tryptophan halogenase